MRPKINDEITVKIGKTDQKGRGIFEIGSKPGLAYFTIPGETVSGTITSRAKGALRLGKIDVLDASPDRLVPPCQSAGRCGGCPWQMMRYERQCAIKLDHVNDELAAAGVKHAVKDLQPAANRFHYRNRMDYVFGPNGELGLKEPEQWSRVLDLPNCLMLSEEAPKIMDTVRSYAAKNGVAPYDARKRNGILRYLVIREGKNTGERMVMIITSGAVKKLPSEKELVAAIAPLATSIIHGINPEMTDLSIPKTIRPLFGDPFLKEEINAFTYKIQPASFFQTNSEMAARLQDTVVEFAALNEKEICLDLYSGCGFLSLPLARHAKELIGVELDEPAVAAARENAALNSAKNAIFSSGASETLLPITLSRDKPDVIVVDPPRPGLHPEALVELVRYGAKRLVYVSCNPASLARDLKTLLNIYRIKKSRCLDLFPHTPHIETVVALSLKQ